VSTPGCVDSQLWLTTTGTFRAHLLHQAPHMWGAGRHKCPAAHRVLVSPRSAEGEPLLIATWT